VNTVVVVGVGLIGGSFAAGIRKAGFRGEIVGVSSPDTIRQAVDMGIIQRGALLEDAIPEADLVYLAQPVADIVKTIGRLDPLVKDGALVTDAGSTKVKIVAAAKRKLKRCVFVGGHPMAGKEQRGVQAADPSLFQGRTYFLTPSSNGVMDSPSGRVLRDWILRLGALPQVIKADEHDAVVAFTSHLPQLVSTALAETVGRAGSAELLQVAAGPGLVDATRLALSPYEIWKDVIDTNRSQIEAALDSFIKNLQKIRKSLGTPDLERHFAGAKESARHWR
jgi:prephenate dehydrogenase